MRSAPLVAIAVLALSIPALSAQEAKPPEEVTPPQQMSQSQGVSPAVLEEVTKMADAAFKAATPPKPTKTPEQVAADKKAIESHCDALYARVKERVPELPGSCE